MYKHGKIIERRNFEFLTNLYPPSHDSFINNFTILFAISDIFKISCGSSHISQLNGSKLYYGISSIQLAAENTDILMASETKLESSSREGQFSIEVTVHILDQIGNREE